VRDVREAVKLASDYKRAGEYDWFRGQLQDWPLKSSFARLAKPDQEQALDKVARFEHWVKTTTGLQSLASSVDAFAAVAQHYGLPTNYIDFTTNPEVAGFFAADNPNNRTLEKESCIICLNTSDLRDFWKDMPSEHPPPEFIQLDVANLWRLEAQEGCFLFCPYGDFEHVYDLDRILFPYTAPLAGIPRARIYPAEKSALEIALDQYFMNETMIAGTRMIESMSGFRNAHRVKSEDTGGRSPDLVRGPIPRHRSWDPGLLQGWIETATEKYSHVSAGPSVTITLNRKPDYSRICGDIASQVNSHFERNKSIRTQSVAWNLIGAGQAASARPPLTASLNRLWDGLRVLPYRDEEVAFSIGQCVALWLARQARGSFDDAPERAAGMCFGDCVEIEFGAADGSYSRAFASGGALLKAVRDDIDSYLATQYADRLRGNIVDLLRAVQDPSRLFDYSRLAGVFVTQIVPFQALYRRSDLAVFYSPARLDRLSLP
jgi:hypothetical protein